MDGDFVGPLSFEQIALATNKLQGYGYWTNYGDPQ